MGFTQTCSITQSSATGNNLAIVFESIERLPGRINSATQTATITQVAAGASNRNTACVTQNVRLNRSGKRKSFTSNLNAHQTVNVVQDVTGSGANSAQFAAKLNGTCDLAHPLTQRQALTSVATSTGAVTQNENARSAGPNLIIDIAQNQGDGLGVAGGPNSATFVQTNTLVAIANSTNGPIRQTQSSAGGGLLATINQDSTGISTANATQTETECEDAAKSGLTQCDTADLDASEAPASLTQTQFGPVHKGVGISTQTGNANDTFTVDQLSIQDNDTGEGQTNLVQGDCSTPGNCTVTQTIDENGQQSTNTQSGHEVNITTICTGSECTKPPVTVRELNPSSNPASGACQDGLASGTGFQGAPQEVQENVDLSQFDGKTIRLNFSFATGDERFNGFEGWYVRNIRVTGVVGESPVTVFSDVVADGDTNFTASSEFGDAPGWHVTHRRDGTFGGPAWWYGNETTGSYRSPGFTDACLDTSTNEGMITSAPFTLASSSRLDFDTLWQVESVEPSTFDLMDVQVIEVLGG